MTATGADSTIARVVSVQRGLPRRVRDALRDRMVRTGIWKDPVVGPVRVRALGLEGDGVADPRFHGGVDKAVYAFPFEHYGFFAEALGRGDLSPGSFGENLTTAGLLEGDLRIGDELLVGDVVLVVTQPRVPCYKLGLRLGEDAPGHFLRAGRPGFYLRVAAEGSLAAGDEVTHRRVAPPGAPTVAAVYARTVERALRRRPAPAADADGEDDAT